MYLVLPLASEGKLYRCLVLGVLLYGCESWVLTSKLRQRLSAFHKRCVRAMARKKPLRASSSDYFFKYAALAPKYVAGRPRHHRHRPVYFQSKITLGGTYM